MRIVVFGAGGKMGTRIAREAATRGHQVVAVARNDAALADLPDSVERTAGDVLDADVVGALATGADAVVLTVGGPGRTLYREAAEAALTALGRLDDAPRVIHFGGGASLLTPDGTPFLDTPEFPAAWVDPAGGQADALASYRASDIGVHWTFFSPPPKSFTVGERTGRDRLGKDEPVYDADGNAALSYEDAAVAIVDEIENGAFVDQRFTAGY